MSDTMIFEWNRTWGGAAHDMGDDITLGNSSNRE